MSFDKVSYIIQVKGQNLFLHKTSNMFTTDIAQARIYLVRANARHWIESRQEDNEYNKRFAEFEFEIRDVPKDVEGSKEQRKERLNQYYTEQFGKTVRGGN